MSESVKVQPIVGPMVAVQYPYRKTPDLYVALKGQPVFCARCNITFPPEEFSTHIQSHNNPRRRKP